MAKKNHKTTCDCIYCNSKCPECESTDISVDFKVKFHYDNDEMNSLDIGIEEDIVELECHDCGETFSYGNFDFDSGTDEGLQPLYAALGKYLASPLTKIKIDHKGQITTEEYTYEVRGGD